MTKMEILTIGGLRNQKQTSHLRAIVLSISTVITRCLEKT